MIVGSAADHLVAKAKEFVAHGLGIGDDLLLVGHILGLLSLEEGNRLGGYHVLQRASLATGEYIRVEHLAHLLDYALGVGTALGIVEVLPHEDNTAARSAQSLVRSRSDDMGIRQRILEQAGSDKTSRVGHVYPQYGAHFVRNGAHALVIPLARIGRGASHNELRLVLQGKLLHLVIIDPAGLRIKPVSYHFI